MNKNVKEYFINLENKKLRTRNNLILEDNEIIQKQEYLDNESGKRKTYIYDVDGDSFYGKVNTTKHLHTYAHEIASSKFLGDMGIITPPQYPFRAIVDKHGKQYIRAHGLLSQNVQTINGIDCTIANDIKEFKLLPIESSDFFVTTNQWQILCDESIREQCLEIMTPECYEEIIKFFMLEELRTSGDTHLYNYFLYKLEGSDKFNGVIPIDLEESSIINYNYPVRNSDAFNTFIHHFPYQSTLPFRNNYDYTGMGFLNYYDFRTYYGRMRTFKDTIANGKLSNDLMTFLKQVINYDFPKLIADTCDKYHLGDDTKQVCSIVDRLWDYNYKNLDKEL